jgi:hypothetical protein
VPGLWQWLRVCLLGGGCCGLGAGAGASPGADAELTFGAYIPHLTWGERSGR